MNFNVLTSSQQFLSEEEKYDFEQKYEKVKLKRLPVNVDFSKVYSLDKKLAVKSLNFSYKLYAMRKFNISDHIFEQESLERELNSLEQLYMNGFQVPKPLGIVSSNKFPYGKSYLLLEHKGGISPINMLDKDNLLIVRNLIEKETKRLNAHHILNYNPLMENALYNPENMKITFFGTTQTQKIPPKYSYSNISQPGLKLVTE